jgi:hypothetical protein
MHRGCQAPRGYWIEPASSGWVNLLLTGFPRGKDTQERADNKRRFRRLWKARLRRQPNCKVCTVESRYFAVSGVLVLEVPASRSCGRAARVCLNCARVCLLCDGSFRRIWRRRAMLAAMESASVVAAEPQKHGGSPRIYSEEERLSAPKQGSRLRCALALGSRHFCSVAL